jgi:hypothetical protein
MVSVDLATAHQHAHRADFAAIACSSIGSWIDLPAALS